MTPRTKNLFLQLKASFIYKILTIVLSFLIIKYMLPYLGVELYGVWAVILTFVNWIIFFDFGITNGVKNKIAESLTNNNYEEANQYISTGYIILLLFCIVVYIIFFTLSYFLNWQGILNITTISNNNLFYAMNTIIFFILINFTLSIIIAVLNAVQKASLIVLGQFLSQLFSLIFILILIQYTESNLIYICFSYGFALVLSNILLSVLFYRKNLKLVPTIKNFKKTKVQSILSLGMKFFFLQLTILVILTTDTVIITQLLGPQYVTTYDILFKYFGVMFTIHTIVNTPLWSMYTEAHIKNDYIWISKTLINMLKLIVIFILLATIMYLLKDIVFKLWIGDTKLFVSESNYIYMIIMVLMLIWHNTFAFFTNGINKTKNQLISTAVGALINIPLSIFFVKYVDMGLNGVLLATICSLSIFNITGIIEAAKEIQYMKKQGIIKHENFNS